jgi:hypothetical protein
MPHLVSEKWIGFAVLLIASGFFLIIEVSVFPTPVVLSEKGLLLTIAGIGLAIAGLAVGRRAIKTV